MRWCTSQSRHVFVKGFVQQLKRPLTWPRGFGEGVNVAELSPEPDLDAREQATIVPLSVARMRRRVSSCTATETLLPPVCGDDTHCFLAIVTPPERLRSGKRQASPAGAA